MQVADTEDLRAKLDRRHRLFAASIEITLRCNLRCVHCLRNLDNDDGLTFSEIGDVLDQLVALGCMNLTFTGGEPFARRDFMDIARLAWAKRLSVRIMTNGTLVTADVAAELKRLHVAELQFSVYAADPGVHDAITQQQGSLERTLRAIDLAREQGLKIRIAMPLMAMNADQAPAVKALCDSQGLVFAQGPLIFPKNDGDRQPLRTVATAEQLSAVVDKASAEECARQTLAVQRGAGGGLCSAGRDRLGIGADGSVYPCDAWRLSLGNVRTHRLADIWFTDQRLSELRSIRRQHLQTCSGCSARDGCIWCPGLSLELLGDAGVPNSQDCRRTRLGYAHASADAPGWSVPENLQRC
jgi:radical SAM protein with 4Fe4S-binding SPASM domain